MTEKIDWIKVRREAQRQILESEKCFCCSRKAVAVANTCSLTSSSGMTSPRPWCAYCLLSICGGANILQWKIPIDEVRKALENAIAFAKDRIKHSVNVASNKVVMIRGHQLLIKFDAGILKVDGEMKK